MRTNVICGLPAGALFILIGLGCESPASKPSLTDPDPAAKIPAMREAVRKRDYTGVRQLVKDLESDDPAIRFYAIYTLEQLTGERNGYDYFADQPSRDKAVQQWQQWLMAQEPSTRPATRLSDR